MNAASGLGLALPAARTGGGVIGAVGAYLGRPFSITLANAVGDALGEEAAAP